MCWPLPPAFTIASGRILALSSFGGVDGALAAMLTREGIEGGGGVAILRSWQIVADVCREPGVSTVRQHDTATAELPGFSRS